jgi:hypothetical protein
MATTYSGGTGTSAPVVSSTGYPVSVTFQRQPSYNRFFAIPLIGIIARSVLLIPHFIALYIVGAITGLMHLVAWFPVLTSGSYPEWAYTWSTGTMRWSARVIAYLFGLTDQYPPFALGSNDDGYPVQLAVQYPSNPGKFFAIPVIGYAVRYIALIPHFIVLYVIYAIAGLVQLVAWVPVLTSGQYPEWAEQWTGGLIRWFARVQAYIYGLSDQYPPFSLSN